MIRDNGERRGLRERKAIGVIRAPKANKGSRETEDSPARMGFRVCLERMDDPLKKVSKGSLDPRDPQQDPALVIVEVERGVSRVHQGCQDPQENQ